MLTVAQACQTSMYLFAGGVQFNGAITNLGACIATIVGVPIVEGCIFQFIEKKRNSAISRKSSYICGFLLAILANACAILIEQMRRDSLFQV